MSTNSYLITEAQFREVCICPAFGEMLLNYIENPLEEPAAEEVEDHLLDCRHCRERYLEIISIRATARKC